MSFFKNFIFTFLRSIHITLVYSENLQSNANSISVAQTTFPQTNKSVIQQTMSRVKKLKHKFASSRIYYWEIRNYVEFFNAPSTLGHVSEFERQQEEWFNRPSIQSKLVGSSSCNEDIHVSLDGSRSLTQMGTNDSKPPTQSFEYSHTNLLPLHKWQRSITSYVSAIISPIMEFVKYFCHLYLLRIIILKVSSGFHN